MGLFVAPFITNMTIHQKYLRFKALEKQLRNIASDVLFQNQDVYLDLQREQMLRGENSQGGEIGTYKILAYAEMKERMNPLAGGTVDGKLTGDFHRELTLRLMSARKFLVYSQDEKNQKLTKMYDHLFLLNPNYLYEYRKKFFMSELKKKANEFTSST